VNLLPLRIGTYIADCNFDHGRCDETSCFHGACPSLVAVFVMSANKAVYGFRCSGMLAARWYH
jgi:hypothetical protein